MDKLVVVEGDPVNGKDTHKVTGSTTSSPPATYTGTADFVYSGSMTQAVSDLVRINGTPVALVTSRSTLPPAETLPPSGKHSGPQGSNFIPPAPAPQPLTLVITDAPLGVGTPGAVAGSTLLTVDGVKVLLDGDPVDTCSGIGAPAGSKVSARGQSLVTCSE
ncbi:hypothetical protein ABT174_33625 [Streptomyces sparsogenes]|uniref:hypothetical protein n=1 Tax=Streptomyces sparsogenes TaxID=67365 RepID=UPI0033316970